MFASLIALVLGGCGGGPGAEGAKPAPGGPRGPPPPQGGSLVLPVDNPVWNDLHGLLDNPQAYGEASWDDVRMRVLGHLAVIGRDRARAAALRSDWAECQKRYVENAAALGSVHVSGEVGPPIQAALVAASTRDAALCGALAAGAPPPPGTGTIAPLRAAWVGLVVRAGHGENIRKEAADLAARARQVTVPTGLDLDSFGNFEERHKLRVRLTEAWADAVSPFAPTEPFDYWTGEEIRRQAAGISAAGAAVAGGASPDPTLPDTSIPAPPPSPYTAAELGSLVTGDSTVDTIGFAGPRAIGSLARLGVDDKDHQPWLKETVDELNAASPSEVPAIVARRADELDRFPGGIRYYAIKQLKNTAVRHLARSGHPVEALAILATNLPLHNQDWACPDRAAILVAIEGRLRLVGRVPTAEATLDRGLAEVTSFLDHVAKAEASGKQGARP